MGNSEEEGGGWRWFLCGSECEYGGGWTKREGWREGGELAEMLGGVSWQFLVMMGSDLL